MVLEAAELSLPESNIKPPAIPEQWRSKEPLDDESSNTAVPILQPLKPVKYTFEKERHGQKEVVERDFDEALKKEFTYYSRTRDLEVNTPRTKVLQDIVDKMTAGTGVETRVVIMNKGKGYEAFVMPDGSIFISQSILNSLSSIDEVGAILGHEVGHLVLKTHERRVKADKISSKVAIPWIHEGVSDAVAREFSAKAGLNSFAFDTGIEKISGAARGIEHQGGYMRSSQGTAQHSAIHYETSAKEPEPIPISLLRRVRPTNYEIIKGKIEKNEARGLKDSLAKLHPRDLETGYFEILHKFFNGRQFFSREEIKTLPILDQFNSLLKEKLANAGYTHEQILAWMLGQSAHNRYQFVNVEDAPNVAEIIVKVSKEGLIRDEGKDRRIYFNRMSEVVFEKSDNSDDPLVRFLEVLENYIYDQPSGKVEYGIPVTYETILDILAKINSLKDRYPLESYVPHILAAYIERSYYLNATDAQEPLDEEQIIAFLDEAKEMGLLAESSGRLMIGKAANRLSSIAGRFSRESLESKNYEKVLETIKNYFGRKEWQPFQDITQEIDKFYNEVTAKREYINFGGILGPFLGELRRTFDETGLDDTQRGQYIQYLSGKLSGLPVPGYSIRKRLEGERSDWLNIFDVKENAKLANLGRDLILAVYLFRNDGDEFYGFVENSMQKSGIDIASFSRPAIVNLCSPLFSSSKGIGSYTGLFVFGPSNVPLLESSNNNADESYIPITNYDRFVNLPFVKNVIDRREGGDLSTWQGLRASVAAVAEKMDGNMFRDAGFTGRGGSTDDKAGYDIFTDITISLILFPEHRQAFLKLLEKPIDEADLSQIHGTVDLIYPAGTDKTAIMQAIQKKYLESKDIPLENKIDYLYANAESLGPEGALIVAEQITAISDYEKFRARMGDKLAAYLNGDGKALKGLVADLITSLLSYGYEQVIKTTIDDEQSSRKFSTEFADNWFVHNFNTKDVEHTGRPRYDPAEKRFVTGTKSRVTFRSIKDAIQTLQNLTHTQRFIILQKALADSGGALSSDDGREKLATITAQALQLGPGFVKDTIEAACKIGEPRLVSFLAANMLAPMLFRALDPNQVDPQELLWRYDITPQEAGKIINSDTRELMVFGSKFSRQPNSYLCQEAQTSDELYHQIRDILEKQLLSESNGTETTEESELDPSQEAVVKGVEASGALGVRSLQNAKQLMRLPPKLDRRFSQSLDSNPGMTKLVHWERLYRWANGNPERQRLLRALEVNEQLGAGSLVTTRAAILTDPTTGERRKVVVKALNTNAEGFIEQYHAAADKVLREVEKRGTDKELAKTARMLLDVSREWCKADIHDQTFAEDDDNFRKTIKGFDQEAGREIFSSPERVFADEDIKIEGMAEGPTLNKILNDDSIPQEKKQELVENLLRFFAYQIKNPVTDETGVPTYYIHSDPHVGNYIVDDSGIAVIDRSMYLKLDQADIDVINNLFTPGNSTAFVNQFVTRVLDENSSTITNRARRSAIWLQVWTALGKELGSQVMKGNTDNARLLRTLFNSLDSQGARVPLDLRLMIKNIGSVKELGEKHGLKLEDYFKETRGI